MKAKALIKQLTGAVNGHYAEDMAVVVVQPDGGRVDLEGISVDGNTVVLVPRGAENADLDAAESAAINQGVDA